MLEDAARLFSVRLVIFHKHSVWVVVVCLRRGEPESLLGYSEPDRCRERENPQHLAGIVVEFEFSRNGHGTDFGGVVERPVVVSGKPCEYVGEQRVVEAVVSVNPADVVFGACLLYTSPSPRDA